MILASSEPRVLYVRRRSFGTGLTLVILGIIGLALAGVAYATWEENKDNLELMEMYGIDTPEDHRIVETQTIVVLSGFLIGGPLLIIGVVAIALVARYNTRLDKLALEQARASQSQARPTPPTANGLCSHCGAPMSNPRYCRACGRMVQ